jgi:hypothetical protein
MPAPPYFAQLPLDGNSRRYVDQPAWDSVIGAFYAWPDHVNANQKNLSNLGVLAFGAGGYISGNVGIATSPLTKFHLAGSAAPGIISVENEFNLSRTGVSSVTCPIAATFALGRYDASTAYPNTRVDLLLKSVADPNEVGDTAVMTWWSNGNVGINTVNPGANLHVAGDVYRQLYLTGASAPTSQMRVGYDVSNNTGVVEVLANGAARPLLLNPLGGNVGVGYNDPRTTLHVHGTGLAFSSSNANYQYRIAPSADQTALHIGYWTTQWYTGTDNPPIKLSYDGYIAMRIGAAAADAFIGNQGGQVFVDEAGKTIYMRYKDSGGVCHSVPLGSWI